MLGKIEYDNGKLSLTINYITMQNGMVEMSASTYVNSADELPTGLVTFAMYGTDNTLIAVSKCDTTEMFNAVRGQMPNHLTAHQTFDLKHLEFTS